MKRCPLPEILENGWIGPLRKPVAARARAVSRISLLQDLVAAGWYVADSANIARNVLAAAAPPRRH